MHGFFAIFAKILLTYEKSFTNCVVPCCGGYGEVPRTAEECREGNVPVVDYGKHEAFVRASIPRSEAEWRVLHKPYLGRLRQVQERSYGLHATL